MVFASGAQEKSGGKRVGNVLRNMLNAIFLDALFRCQVLKNRRACVSQSREAERFMAH